MSQSSYEPLLPTKYEAEQPEGIVVPPPILDYGENGQPISSVPGTASFAYQDEYFGKSEFMRQLTSNCLITPQRLLDWQYSERRTAQMVLPWVMLGPSSAARDQELLRRSQITLLLAVRSDKSAQARMLSGARVAGEMGIQHLDIDVSSISNLRSHFITAIRAINVNLEQHCTDINTITSDRSFPGRTLIFCESGNGRSAAIAAAYMMAMFSLNMVQAVQSIQAQRFCISLDDEQRQILLDFGDMLQAQRDVSTAHGSSNDGKGFGLSQSMAGNVNRLVKRTRDKVDDDDEDMDDDGFDGGEQGRGGAAPFRDRIGT
ncbi:MAG: hypothetical protein Q9227_006943 [Pyrenula ochraceoflavens]